MEKIKFIMLLLVALFATVSCEKPFSDDEEESTEKKENVEEEEKDDEVPDDGEISLGDVVDVATFCNVPIYPQIWLKGYVVGAATGANGKVRYEFEPPFHYDTAILLADTPVADSNTEVASVCLTNETKSRRKELNLVDSPHNYGRIIYVFGFQETYLRINGIKKIDAFRFSD